MKNQIKKNQGKWKNQKGFPHPKILPKNQKREADKDTSDRKTRDKNKTVPKRADQDSRPR